MEETDARSLCYIVGIAERFAAAAAISLPRHSRRQEWPRGRIAFARQRFFGAAFKEPRKVRFPFIYTHPCLYLHIICTMRGGGECRLISVENALDLSLSMRHSLLYMNGV